jgi:hypothetical protein
VQSIDKMKGSMLMEMAKRMPTKDAGISSKSSF